MLIVTPFQPLWLFPHGRALTAACFEDYRLQGLYVSESTIYRVLKRESLIKLVEAMGFKADKDYHRKTKGPSELWATDCVHLKVVEWG